MYDIDQVIEFLKTREVPEAWKKQLNWSEKEFAIMSLEIMSWLSSSIYLPNKKPYKTHLGKGVFNRYKEFLPCVPNLFVLLEFHDSGFDFRKEIGNDKIDEIHKWVTENYKGPQLRA